MSKELVLNGEDADSSTADGTTAARQGTDWWGEVKGIFWLLVAVLGFHSFIAKPFYIPSESMMPGLLIGDRLVVTKYPYGWSFVSPTIPNPVAIFRSVVLRQPVESWGVQLAPVAGRVLGRMPERGDVVIAIPPGSNVDYIKRVIGLPGDKLQVRDGIVYLNNVAIKRSAPRDIVIPVDDNAQCLPTDYPGARAIDGDGRMVCRLPMVRETLPNGRSYDTIDLGWSEGDDYGPVAIPAGHVFLMGDSRDRSADSRFPTGYAHGLGGPVPWENVGGRAEFITFSLDGTTGLNPATWWPSLRADRAGRTLHPGTAPAGTAQSGATQPGIEKR